MEQQTARKRGLRPDGWEAALMGACALILALQLFIPPFIGLANNGDFPKVAGRLCIGGGEADNFAYFRSDFERAERHCWHAEGVRSSEFALAWIASSAEQAFGDGRTFDIRWLGGVHAVLFLVFFYLLLLAVRPLARPIRVILALFALWVFADVSTISYFNTFYTDTAGILGALLTVVLAVRIVAGAAGRGNWILFALAACLFITSKAQHGLFFLAPASLPLVAAFRRPRRMRVMELAAFGVLAASAAWIVLNTPQWYTGQARFNLIFFRLLPTSPDPARDIRLLGLKSEELRYSGMHSFSPGGPAENFEWMMDFSRRTGYGAVLGLYLREPWRALHILRSDLRDHAHQRRAHNLSNYRREDGRPPGARTGRFASWSDLRTGLFLAWPGHIVLWFAAVVSGCVVVAWKSGPGVRRALAFICLAAALCAVGEYGLASLADAIETHRHLLLFHVLTDVTAMFAIAYLLDVAAARRKRAY